MSQRLNAPIFWPRFPISSSHFLHRHSLFVKRHSIAAPSEPSFESSCLPCTPRTNTLLALPTRSALLPPSPSNSMSLHLWPPQHTPQQTTQSLARLRLLAVTSPSTDKDFSTSLMSVANLGAFHQFLQTSTMPRPSSLGRESSLTILCGMKQLRILFHSPRNVK